MRTTSALVSSSSRYPPLLLFFFCISPLLFSFEQTEDAPAACAGILCNACASSLAMDGRLKKKLVREESSSLERDEFLPFFFSVRKYNGGMLQSFRKNETFCKIFVKGKKFLKLLSSPSFGRCQLKPIFQEINSIPRSSSLLFFFLSFRGREIKHIVQLLYQIFLILIYTSDIIEPVHQFT